MNDSYPMIQINNRPCSSKTDGEDNKTKKLTVWAAIGTPLAYEFLVEINKANGSHYSDLMKRFDTSTKTIYIIRRLMRAGLIIKRPGRIFDSWEIYTITERGKTALDFIERILVALK